MATVGSNSTIGVPGVVDNFGTALSQNGSSRTGVVTDIVTSFTAGSGLTMVDSVLVTDEWDFGGNIAEFSVTSDITDSRIHFTYDEDSEAQPDNTNNNDWIGTHIFDGATFQMDAADSRVRYIFGGSTSNTRWRMIVNGDGLKLANYSAAQLVLHGANLRGITGDGSIDLIGNTFSQASAEVNIFNITPSDVADTESFDNGGAYGNNTYGYSYRMAHQAGIDNSVNSIAEGTGGRAALYTNFDLTNIVAEGSQFYTATSVTTVTRQSTLQLNRRVAWWMLDPIMSNGPGEVNAGRSLSLGFHTGNPPGNNGESSQDSEIRMFIGDRVVGRNAATGALVDGEYKIRYSNPARIVPEDWDSNNLPLETVGNDVVFDQDSTDLVDPTPHNGAMVQAYRRRYGVGSGTDAADDDTTSSTGRDPANAANTFNALPTDIVRTTRHFDFDFPYESMVEPNYTGGSTGLVALNERRIDGTSISQYLNGRTAITAPTSGIVDYADVYASVRRAFFEGSPLGSMPVTGSGSTLSFDRDTTMSVTDSTAYTGTLIVLGVSSATTVISGDNTTFNFNGNLVNWDNIRIPEGITLEAGNHRNLNADVAFGAYTVAGQASLRLNAPTSTFNGLDGLLGDITYGAGADIALVNANPITVQIAEDDIPSAISYTPGSNTFGTNITREDPPAAIQFRDVIPNVPAGSNGYFIIRNLDANTNIVRTITNGVINGSDFSISENSNTNFRSYYKLDGDITLAEPIDYEIRIDSFTGASLAGDFVIEARQVPLPFTRDALNVSIDLVTTSSSGSTFTFTWPASFTNMPDQTVSRIILARTGIAWIQYHADNEFDAELFSLGNNFATQWNNLAAPDVTLGPNDGVFFASGDINTKTVTQQEGFKSDTFTLTSGGSTPQVSNVNVGNAPIGIVTSAVQTVIDGSTFATDISDIQGTVDTMAPQIVDILVDTNVIESALPDIQTSLSTTIPNSLSSIDTDIGNGNNALGYLVSGSSKLLGLKPKAANYASGTDYTGDL